MRNVVRDNFCRIETIKNINLGQKLVNKDSADVVRIKVFFE